MKRLILFRHAKAVPGEADHARPLAPQGLEDATRAGATLAARGWTIDRALVSDARRTRETFAQAATALAPVPALQIDATLYHATPDEIVAMVSRTPDAVAGVMVIGHNPGLALLAMALATGDEAARSRLASGFPTAALAVFRLDTVAWAAMDRCPARLEAMIAPP